MRDFFFSSVNNDQDGRSAVGSEMAFSVRWVWRKLFVEARP